MEEVKEGLNEMEKKEIEWNEMDVEIDDTV